MSNTVIKVENLSKQYRLGQIGTGSLAHDINRWWHKVRGNEDPYLKVGETNDRTSKGNSEYVWSLRDVSFEIKQGDAVGIIGRNGAGKSTLLKILSRTTMPTIGSIKIKGRVASLLEVGTGFHPELSGRENIFLNGAILGMTKVEIKRKFDEIVDFAGVERYIDTPVKRYSSGMYVRLAFGVAAHLEPEILIVDEVLAVGDAEFQKKALGKMQDVSKGEGRTVLFVSHNMAAVKQLCTTGIVMQNGGLIYKGGVVDAVNTYNSSSEIDSCFEHTGRLEEAPGNTNFRLLKFLVKPLVGSVISISSGITFTLEFYHHLHAGNLAVTFELRNIDETVVFHHGTWLCEKKDSEQGIYTISGKLDPNTLNGGIYKFGIIVAENLHSVLYMRNDIVQFEVNNEILAGNSTLLPGIMRPAIDYQIEFQKNII